MTVGSLQFKFEGVAMRSFCGFLFFFVRSLWLIPAGQAQSGKGAIAGHVSDRSGGALVGAQATVQPKAGSVVYDARGRFLIRDREPSSYSVTNTYVRLAP